jgi:hypothetical protein
VWDSVRVDADIRGRELAEDGGIEDDQILNTKKLDRAVWLK